MSFPQPPDITAISAGQTAVSSVSVLDTNYNEIKAAIAAAVDAFKTFNLAIYGPGGLVVSSSSPSDLPITGTGLTVQLVTGSRWLIGGLEITIGDPNVVIAGLTDNATNYVYLTLDSDGTPIFDSSHASPTPVEGKPCVGLVTCAGGSASSIDTTKTNLVKTYAYLNSSAGGGGGGSDDDSDLYAICANLQVQITALQNAAATNTTISAVAPSDIPLTETMRISGQLELIDPASGDDATIIAVMPGVTGTGEQRIDGTSAPDSRAGGDGQLDVTKHVVS